MKWIFFIAWPLFANIDLEADPDPFVLDLKRIEIPGFPHAFNPSVVRFDDKFLMSFRLIPDRKNSYVSFIGLVLLDQDFNVIGAPQILRTRSPRSTVPSRAEDARLIFVGQRLYMIYSDNDDPILSGGGFRLFLAEVRCDGEIFTLMEPEKLTQYEGADPKLREKSWTPFVSDGALLLAYSISPHRVFAPLFGTGICKTVAETQGDMLWSWGKIRGSTPALQGVADRDEYLSFFHSSIRMQSLQSDGKNILHYFFGAYTCSAEPPFHVTRISPRPIYAKGFYSGTMYTPYWHPVRVIFPAGYIFDETNIYLFYGRQDHEIWVAKIDRKGFMESLIPVHTIQ